MDKRYLELKDIECRAGENNALTMSGYAVKFGTPSGLLYGEFIEYIDRGAFDGVELNNTFLLYNHNSDYVLGNTRSGTLKLTVTEVGLRFSVDLPNTEKAKEVHELVKRGDINGMSFGFTVVGDSWNMEGEPVTRLITQIGELLEISIVPYPAYEATEVDARTMERLGECKSCQAEVRNLLAPNKALHDEAKQILKEIENEN